MLSSPSSLCCNKKKEEGDGSNTIVTFCDATKKRKKAMATTPCLLQQKKKKATTRNKRTRRLNVGSLPSSSRSGSRMNPASGTPELRASFAPGLALAPLPLQQFPSSGFAPTPIVLGFWRWSER